MRQQPRCKVPDCRDQASDEIQSYLHLIFESLADEAEVIAFSFDVADEDEWTLKP